MRKARRKTRCPTDSVWASTSANRYSSPVGRFILSNRGLSTAVGLLCAASGCEPPPLTPNGVIDVFGGVGLGPGAFSYPRAITSAADGSIFVVDKSGRVQRFGADGEFEALWRMPKITQGKPVGLTVHPDGRVFVADTHCHRVSIFDRDGRPLGTFGREGAGPGEFLLPTDVAIDADGFIYVSEYQGNDRISKWSPDLRFVTSFGEAPIQGLRLSRPAGLDIDGEQTLWVADACNHRIVRFSLDGDVLAAFGEFGPGPGQMRYPYDIAIAPDDTIMVCEYEGNRLQWFDKAGRSLRTWGRSGRNAGELFAPWGATYGPQGRVYIVDSLNSRVQVVQP